MACPRNSLGENTEVDCHSPLQGSNPGLLHCRPILYHLSYQGIYSFDSKNLCQQSDVSVFNTLSRFVIVFLPRSKCLLISWLWSPFTVILEPPKIKPVTASTFSPSVCHEIMEPDAMILTFGMLSFKPSLSLFSFTLIKRLLTASSLSALIQKNHPLLPFHCLWSPFWISVFNLLALLADMFFIFPTFVPWLLMALSAPRKLCSWLPLWFAFHSLLAWITLVSVLALVMHHLWVLGLHNDTQNLKGRSLLGSPVPVSWVYTRFHFLPSAQWRNSATYWLEYRPRSQSVWTWATIFMSLPTNWGGKCLPPRMAVRIHSWKELNSEPGTNEELCALIITRSYYHIFCSYYHNHYPSSSSNDCILHPTLNILLCDWHDTHEQLTKSWLSEM